MFWILRTRLAYRRKRFETKELGLFGPLKWPVGIAKGRKGVYRPRFPQRHVIAYRISGLGVDGTYVASLGRKATRISTSHAPHIPEFDETRLEQWRHTTRRSTFGEARRRTIMIVSAVQMPVRWQCSVTSCWDLA